MTIRILVKLEITAKIYIHEQTDTIKVFLLPISILDSVAVKKGFMR